MRLTIDVNFVPEQHPRNKSGEFARKGETSIKGLPEGAELKSRTLSRMLKRGAFTFNVSPSTYAKNTYTVTVGSELPHGMLPYGQGRRGGHYDPSIAELRKFDAGTELEHDLPFPKAGYSEKLNLAPDDHIIHRGMSHEEYQNFLKTGEIRSLGESNIGKAQEGLTYWSSDPSEAESYANSFAGGPNKATFTRPAYVVSAKRPDDKDIRKVRGTGETEIGVARPIPANEVTAVHRGRVYAFRHGEVDLKHYDIDNTLMEGSGSSPLSQVIWEKVQKGAAHH